MSTVVMKRYPVLTIKCSDILKHLKNITLGAQPGDLSLKGHKPHSHSTKIMRGN